MPFSPQTRGNKCSLPRLNSSSVIAFVGFKLWTNLSARPKPIQGRKICQLPPVLDFLSSYLSAGTAPEVPQDRSNCFATGISPSLWKTLCKVRLKCEPRELLLTELSQGHCPYGCEPMRVASTARGMITSSVVYDFPFRSPGQ